MPYPFIQSLQYVFTGKSDIKSAETDEHRAMRGNVSTQLELPYTVKFSVEDR